MRTVISTRYPVRSNWNLEVFVQPRTQACSRYPSDQRRLGTERDSVLGEFSRQAWQVTSHPKSPRTTGNEAGVCFLVEEKNGVPGEKPLVARKITNNKLTHILCCRHWDLNAGHTSVGGECCHHCATPPLLQLLLCASLKGKAFMWFYFVSF